MKSTPSCLNMFEDKLPKLSLDICGRRQSCTSKIARETKTAVNRLAARPMPRVTAKPRTGPVPKMKRKALATTVVTWVSTIVTSARSNPEDTAGAMC